MHTRTHTYTRVHVSQGLMAIHERGIAHRDIKPSNLMIYYSTASASASKSQSPPPQHTATHCNTLQHTATHCNGSAHASKSPPLHITHPHHTTNNTHDIRDPCVSHTHTSRDARHTQPSACDARATGKYSQKSACCSIYHTQ